MGSTLSAAYGYCPTCGAMGLTRERRPNGTDRCLNGHVYPSKNAMPVSLKNLGTAQKPPELPPSSPASVSFIDLREFWKSGLLEEVNRLYFWPRGLALTVNFDLHSEAVYLAGIQKLNTDPTVPTPDFS